MNKKSTAVTISQKFFLRISAILSKTSIASNFLVLAIVSAIMISATINVNAICQTPQFGLPIVINVTRPVAAASGDFNRDGTIDIAVLKSNTTGSPPVTIEVFAGNGNGIFTSTGVQYSAFTTGSGYDLATADFNNDGRLDLVATGSATLETAILLGNASGGFSSPTNFNANDSRAVAVGDFNNDGNMDIITKGFEIASILPGQGNGSFGAAIVIALGGNGYARSITVTNFNNDGFLDFTSALDNNPRAASIRLGSGNFIFSSPPLITSSATEDATVNDFNRDGRPDIAIVKESLSGSVSVHLGFGDGTFSTSNGSPFPTNGRFPQSVISGDFNSDNIPDIAVGNLDVSNSLSILLNNGAGVFGTGFNLSPGQNTTERLLTFDFNRNGATDLIAVKLTTENQVIVLPNLCPPASRNNFPDFDSDGRADISVFRPSNGTWYLNRSTQGNTQTQFGISTDKLIPADYDGDGRIDIALYRAEEGVWYILNSTTNTFRSFLFGFSTDIPVPRDFNGDGKAELAVYRPSNGTWYIFNLVNSQFQAVQFGISSDKVVPADFDGDDRTDLAVYRNGVWWWLRSSDGQVRTVQFGIASDTPTVGDYDGDGRADPAVYRAGVWYILGSTQGFYAIQFGIATDIPVAADYDGDGRTDLAIYRDGVWWWLNSSNGQVRTVQFGLAADKPIPAAFVPQ